MQTFIYIEPSEQGVDPLAKQIATKIKKIPSNLRGPLKGICLRASLKSRESELSGLIDELIMVDLPSGSENNTEVIGNMLTYIMQQNSPAVLFLGFTHQGMELGPVVGWRLNVPVITNCVDFHWTEKGAYVKRPILSGKLFASFSVQLERGAIISVQKGAWKDEILSQSSSDPVSITNLPWKELWAAEKTEVVRIDKEISEEEEDITKAEILVSIGRGLGSPENLPLIKKLSDKLGALISCSRPVVDLGWLPASRQVGISGKTVSPVIYLALGISGQANHIAGMDTSRIIIAVNKDPTAPIFNIAHYGIVDDILELVPELIKHLEQREDLE